MKPAIFTATFPNPKIKVSLIETFMDFNITDIIQSSKIHELCEIKSSDWINRKLKCYFVVSLN